MVLDEAGGGSGGGSKGARLEGKGGGERSVPQMRGRSSPHWAAERFSGTILLLDPSHLGGTTSQWER